MEKEPPEPENPLGIIVIGNIEPDMHDTAKEAVRRSLKRAGFKTIDVGKSVAPQVFVDKAKENNANIIAISVNTVPAKNNLAKLDEALKAAGLKGKVAIIMGGAAVKKEDADALGALFGKNKEEAPELAKKAMGQEINPSDEEKMSFKFNTKQNIYTIGRAKVGGQPGELPTFLIGSIFWLGQKMVQDANKGIFDAKEAEKIINTMQTQSDITGVQFAFDIVGTTDLAFEKYIDFVAKHSDAPLMLDAMSPKTRMTAATIAKKMGLIRQMPVQLSVQRRH